MSLFNMRKYYFPLLLTMIFLLTACSRFPTGDIKVTADSDPKTRFSGYKTYSWLGTSEILHDPDDEWEPLAFDADAELVFLINRELRKRNMKENSSDPDMLVAFTVGVDMDVLQLKQDPKTKIETLQNVPEGALLLVLIDARNGYVIWVSEAVADLQEAPTGEIIKARLNYAVTEMFKLLPKE